MAGERSSKDSSRPQADWRGRSGLRSTVRYRWQQVASSGPRQASGRSRRALKSAMWLVALLTMAAALVYFMGFRPRQTPIIAVVVTQYEAPFLSNAWAFEDMEAIRRLDGNTVRLLGIDNAPGGRDAILAEFTELAAAAVTALRGDEPIVIYLSMHAGLNDRGEPCVIPSAASPFDTCTWLPVRELIQRADRARDNNTRPLLLVVDCHRHRSNWHGTEVSSRFVASLEEAVSEAGVSNLTVMTSCSAGQTSVVAAEYSQTAFGHYFVEGLTGAADHCATGNRNNYVTLSELTQFVERNVARFAKEAFGVRQDVKLFRSSGDNHNPDFVVGWVATGDADGDSIPAAEAAETDVSALWELYDHVSQTSPFNTDAIKWGRVQSEMLRLEDLAQGGAACQVLARLTADGLRQDLAKLDAAGAHVSIDIHTEELHQQLEVLRTFAVESEFRAALEQIQTDRQDENDAELHLAKLLARQRGSDLWDHPQTVASALDTRRLAEQFPPKNAAEILAWTEVHWEQADAVRRDAEDALFAGQDAAGLFRRAAELYEVKSQRATETRHAIEIRNRAFADLFWYARWALDDSVTSVDEDVRDLIRKTELLAAALQNSLPEQRRGPSLPFVSMAAEVADALDSMQGKIDKEYNQLLNTPGAAAETLYRSQSLLHVPLLPSEDPLTGESGPQQRQRLVRRVRELIADHRAGNELSAVASELSAETTPEFSPGGPLALLLSLPELLESGDGQSSVPSDVQELNSLLRSTIRRLPDMIRANLADSDPEIETYRQVLLSAAARIRIMAPLWIPEETIDVVEESRHFDAGLTRLWQCRRTLDDMYGPADNGSQPYFANAAETYLDGFQSSLSESAAMQNRILTVNKALNRRLLAVREGLEVEADSVLLFDGVQLDPVNVRISQRAGLPGDCFPSGRAGVYLATTKNQPLSDTLTWALPSLDHAEGGPFQGQLSLRPTVSAADQAEVFAVTNFRGNQFRSPILVSRSAGKETRVRAEKNDTVTFKVSGTTGAAVSAIVIFDCSQSMAELVPAEAPGEQQSRFQAARAALFHLLEQLSDQSDARVGLTLFGHRVGWNPEQPRQLLLQESYVHGIPTGLRPFEDVESLLPVGRFDTAVLQGIEPALESLIPWGETPLFLSLTEAVEELNQEDPRRSRRIIVMTDGVNHQVNPTRSQRRTIDNVLQSLSGNIRVDIVGFRIPAREAQQATTDFQRITSASGGQFITVDDVHELVSSLGSLVATDQFEVALPNGEIALSAPGQSVTVRLPTPELEAEISFGNAKEAVRVQGGETVVLNLSDDKTQLFVPQWLRGNPKFAALGTGVPFEAGAVECGVEKVKLRGDAAYFSLSLQHTGRRFLQVPESAQVTVFPATADGNRVGARYFADIDVFEVGTPVPCFGFEAAGWPAQATHADIFVSVPSEQTQPVDTIPFRDLRISGERRTLDRPLFGINGVFVYAIADLEGHRTLTIVEKHTETSPGLGTVVVRLRSSVQTLRKTIRFDEQNQVVATTFYFQSSDAAGLADAVIEFTLREDLDRNALRLEMPVTLPVESGDGLLIPGSP